ncbi:TIGR04282 family arsenosugar biosynthesis glycosyltransferase [Microbulbifer thermotolerans]|nr:TIGR04282 family arsenosugar biosynthesis glycosyltransferase [Microbulbifer thermotolerans]
MMRFRDDTVIRIVILAKAPLPGMAKTRLIPALGSEGSACLAAKLLEHTVEQAVKADIGPVELCVAPDRMLPIWSELALRSSLEWSEQKEGDLGERLADAARRTTDKGEAVLLIGTDCPDMTADKLRAAALSLEKNDACMVPVSDGGYALLGLSNYLPTVFLDIPWSTASVASLTRQRIVEAGWTLVEMTALHDIDEPQDLQYLPEDWPVNLHRGFKYNQS